jgi:hypothetical protein
MPAVEYIAATIFSAAFGRPMPAKASWATSPCQAEIDRALFQERHVLGAAFGVARLNQERGIG